MNTAADILLVRFVLAILYALFAVFHAWRQDRKKRNTLETRFSPFAGTYVLPFLLFVLLPLICLLYRLSMEFVLLVVTNLLLDLFVYSLILLALTPLLRKWLLARSIAALWCLPDYFLTYIFIHMLMSDARSEKLTAVPLLVLRLSRTAANLLFGIWAAGFLGVLGWKILSHLRFRNKLLRNCEPLSERELARFKDACSLLHVMEPYLSGKKAKRYLRFYRSPAASTPLSVGLFRRTTCLILPQREYTDEELLLIFRHEIIHLKHQDNGLKFSIAFLCAAGWFLPCLWGGLGKAAEDMELCCDELASGALDEEKRRQYASLLLDAAGPAPGFTTCLSASASGLRYRIERILHPKHKSKGIWLVGVLVAVLALLYGSIGIAFDSGTFREAVFQNAEPASVQIALEETGEAEWQRMLAEQRIYRVEYLVDLGGNYVSFTCHDDQHVWYLMVSEEYVEVDSYEITERSDNHFTIKRTASDECYLFDEPVDPVALDSLLKEIDGSTISYFVLPD